MTRQTSKITVAQFMADYEIPHRNTVSRKCAELGIKVREQKGLTPKNVRDLKEALGIIELETVEAELVEDVLEPTDSLSTAIATTNQSTELGFPQAQPGHTYNIIVLSTAQIENQIATMGQQTEQHLEVLNQVFSAGLTNHANQEFVTAKAKITQAANQATGEALNAVAKKAGFVSEGGE